MDDYELKNATELKVGDIIVNERRPDVVVLGSSKTWTDVFGRTMLKYWCKRTDTGEEGWMLYGPTGHVPVKTGK